MSHHDEDLRHRFTALREEAAREAPEFDGLWRQAAAARGRRRRIPLGTWLALAGAAGALLYAAVRRDAPSALPVETVTMPMLGQWRSPTAFLLRTPGEELLTTVPSLGSAPSLSVLSSFPERRPPS